MQNIRFRLGYLPLLICFLLIGCRTKYKTVKDIDIIQKGKETELRQDFESNNVSVSNAELQQEIKEFKEFVSNLDISYKGEELNDKLEILLNKNNDGGKLIIQGKGNVNYTENVKLELNNFKRELLKYQDSIFDRLAVRLYDIEQEIHQKEHIREKEVNERGFEFGFWFWFLLVVVVIVIVNKLKI